MNLKPSLKSIADDKKVFKTAALMLLGDEFVEKTTDRVEQLKAFTKVATKPEQKKPANHFLATRSKTSLPMAMRVEMEVVGDDTNHTRRPITPDQAPKDVGPTLHAMYRSLGKISGWKYS